MTINVRQRQYGIAKVGKSKALTLLTKDINTCTGLLGINKAGNVIFMAHIDTPFSAWSISQLVDDLLTLDQNIRTFQFFYVVGKRRAITIVSGFLVLAMGILSQVIGDGIVSKIAGLAAVIFSIIWGMSGITRTVLWIRLWHLNALSIKPIVHMRSNTLRGFWTTNVSLFAAKSSMPAISPGERIRDPNFKVAKGNGRWLTKAKGSA